VKAIVYAALIAVNSGFWFAIALAGSNADGKPGWMPFAILALVTVPAVLGIGLGGAIKEKRS
jgi:ABC-type molybdate transport system permease subunit